MTINSEEVAFTVRANDKGGKRRLQRLAGTESVRRFLLHLPPTVVQITLRTS